MDIERLIQLLMESNEFFDKFEKPEIQELLKCCSSKVFEDGDYIFKEETKGSEFYILISGSVVVTKKGKKVDIVREGECLGEMGAISGMARSATAEAIGKLATLEIDYMNIPSLSFQVQAKLYKNMSLLVSNRLRKRLDRIN